MTGASLTHDPPDTSEAAFLGLLNTHIGILHKVTATYAWTPEDRADLAQDIRASLWAAWPKYDATRSFSTWMYRVALNVAISEVRRKTRIQKHHVAFDPTAHDVAAPEDSERVNESMQRLNRALDALDVFNRALLIMHLDDLSHRDIGEVLGMSESNVATKLNRIKQRLKTLFSAASET